MTQSIMNYFFITICAVFFSLTSVLAQEKIDKYIVGKGETVNQIAQKFNVTPYDIYKLNPDAQKGLKPNSVLLIPKSKAKIAEASAKPAAKQSPKTHLVLAKETLFSIEKKYDVSDADLKKANPDLEKLGLQVGQVLNIPSKNSPKTNITPNAAVYHTVLAKETKYSIAKLYNITVAELEQKNPEIIKSNLSLLIR